MNMDATSTDVDYPKTRRHHGVTSRSFVPKGLSVWQVSGMRPVQPGGEMQTSAVTQIMDGDTFGVSPKWTWNNQTGDRVRPTGYDAPEVGTPGATGATERLRQLLLGKQVELRNAVAVDRGRLVCDVVVGGRNLKDYFPTYRT
jgi:endonuclease YncB( thermonuclease family)